MGSVLFFFDFFVFFDFFDFFEFGPFPERKLGGSVHFFF